MICFLNIFNDPVFQLTPKKKPYKGRAASKERKKPMTNNYLFTSESVTEGHPDKVCDQISDGILDACLSQDLASRVACETLATTGLVVVAGEITTKSKFDDEQSPDISQGVTEGEGLFKEQGAGDQGLMFGYACNETAELMPMPIAFAHRLTHRLSEARKKGELKFLRPDGKSQVTIEYKNDKPVRIDTVVVSTQHTPDVSHETLKEAIIEEVVKKSLPKELLKSNTRYFVNPTGRFIVGGPHGDCGLTGRKIIVDTYGGMGRHGGGAFSGKDPTKVDRSACYMARFVAKTIVAARLAERCELQVAYAIGYPEPVSLMVNTFGTGKVPHEKIELAVREIFSFKPANIIRELDLRRPIYRKTSNYGHFGRSEPEFTWEKTGKVEKLKSLIK